MPSIHDTWVSPCFPSTLNAHLGQVYMAKLFRLLDQLLPGTCVSAAHCRLLPQARVEAELFSHALLQLCFRKWGRNPRLWVL